jgi:hypothetical protein
MSSNRDFAELILTKDLPESAPGRRAFLVVQIPVDDVAPSKGHVRGTYLSVEHVEETEDGRIRWRSV